ncbi:MAG: Hpt domain-containing protein [Spirochaetaceae bacterium]|jgi:HPt (histidine-containing phosphotransfer) domain-containing protein|nr:Hpt domain-containing protein [Spirochaetaceae bacterium]
MSDNNIISGADGVVYVNMEEGLKRVVNNNKLYVKLLNKFKVDTNSAELLTTVQAGEYEKAQVMAHTIKGIAANLSLTELFKQSLELETQIKNRAVSPGIQESFKACFNETLTAIDKVIEQYGG